MSGLPQAFFLATSPIIGFALPCFAFQVVPNAHNSCSTTPNLQLAESSKPQQIAYTSTCNDANDQDVYCYKVMDFTEQATVVNSATMYATPQLADDQQAAVQVGTWQGASWDAA